MHRCFYFIYVLIYLLNSNVLSAELDSKKQTKFPPCRACKVFIESFKRGLDKTAKGKFEGGDAAWEEQNQGSYATSEVRLVEIQEHICSDVKEGSDQCYLLNEEHDLIIEEWWFKHQAEEPDIFKYFCIDKLQSCCPDFHYGTNCTPCDGYPDNICSNNGKCSGSGTRKGNGKCKCDPGYSGEKCEECAEGYYESYRDATKFLCSKCHHSCDGKCTKGGAGGCEKCHVGWNRNSNNECVDINECATLRAACSPLQFCVNSEGSYKCLECDRACSGCTGDGPDMCQRCAKGYTLVDKMCVDADQVQRKQHVFITRYLTYLGLCIATCIIFQRNMILASVIGLAVAAYITVSEYYLDKPEINATNLVNTLFPTT
ncbi:cysteine-rich with EGF-like domain protein 2 [Agrilus planipennis]|uniref:Cysteine-rich with EGF-like domain protein 2 n=1 Tax=Agrilus planipennis TaxID=224129 RepID=A0A1W4X5R3_AGRPL|nr:cysteine-rich with EGF-like domain protein 2 [Agrilus planipennis]